MANPLSLSLILVLASLIVHKAASSHHHHNHHGLRSLHFSLFQQETINKTGYIVVNGVAGTGVSPTTTPFGTIFVYQYNLLTTLNSSRVVGSAEGTTLTTSLDGLRSLLIAKITLKVKGYEGSITIVGGIHNTNPSDIPIGGGTGDFMFAQGYVRSSLVDLVGVYKIEFHLYWPPYATK